MYRTGLLGVRRLNLFRQSFAQRRLLSYGNVNRQFATSRFRLASASVAAGSMLGMLAAGSYLALEGSEKIEAEKEALAVVSEKGETEKKGQNGDDSEKKPQSAYDPDTGEINWDCPCLGGMAQGPCGEEFKAAFSCFVYSEEDPKGIDCIEKFKGMQDCFRKYPEHYAEQIKDEEDAAEAAAQLESQSSDQSQPPSEAKMTSPEETKPMKQQEADFEHLEEELKEDTKSSDKGVKPE
ncbi:Mia40p [Lachancea thermotolerans CBS 6340]|uniref:Mitochondrial intermembrane space import and assembly protein 40 n=1 Tax=Lachancea thermotolerans (strain ATCC 56472 / CBS 6340 / NRRL Y-8284) TaxID=559295 RepID=C5DFJ8_LACTC|nr:KLTH0D15686p [Lachancea thermotolerans CBS 6340]CAR22953.1 KLTH0D15686p [Lachancea thermotolerans CBS 6340]